MITEDLSSRGASLWRIVAGGGGLTAGGGLSCLAAAELIALPFGWSCVTWIHLAD